jgi:hygromycin-B 7''-O-kinase
MWLPTVETPDDYRKVNRQDPAHARAVAEICALHGLPAVDLHPFLKGSSLVYAIGTELVIKLYPPILADEGRRESEILKYLADRSMVPAPRPVASGTFDGWEYLVMTRAEGRELKEIWPGLHPAQRRRLAVQAGKMVACLHDLPVATMPLTDEWQPFLYKHLAGCQARHTRLGLSPRLLEQIPAFLDSIQVDLRLAAGRVLLHTEIMIDHLFARQDPEGWNLTGIIDFEPAMIGPPEYELPSVGLFVATGDAEILTDFLTGYGYTPDELTPELSHRILAYTLIHRYSDLTWYLEFMPPLQEKVSLDSLAVRWFPFTPEE